MIWDSGDDLPEDAGQVYLWNGYEETDSVHSVLQYVEAHSERLRGKYLSWIHELGEHEIEGTRLIDVLMLEDGFSYWWMTLLVEKSLWKSPSITDAIRVLALEEIVVQRAPSEVLLVSANRKLHEVILELCRTLGIQYRWEEAVDRRPRRLSLRAVFIRLPMPIQALISTIRYVWTRWPLRGARSSGWFGGERSVFFCSYFFNIDSEQSKEGRFRSRYWGNLHAVLKRSRSSRKLASAVSASRRHTNRRGRSRAPGAIQSPRRRTGVSHFSGRVPLVANRRFRAATVALSQREIPPAEDY